MANSRGFLKSARAKADSLPAIDYGEVARVAYELYEQRGRQSGHDLEDWLQAESIVRGRAGNSSRFSFTHRA